ncbi:hypothetical protein BGX34_009390 [Mortierella sp. NVP85]|nr:hypothetical protein BGX34_009390 [Mortierella sp. NVP85]
MSKSEGPFDLNGQEPIDTPQESGETEVKMKRRTFGNSFKAVGRGMSQSAQVVRGGVTQGTQVVRGGISQVEKGVNNVGGKLNKVPGVKHGVSFFADYRKFMDRGNVIDLAVAVVIGAAFTAIVTSLVTDIITPILALASGKNLEENFVILRRNEDSEQKSWSTRASAQLAGNITWNWGNFLQTVINFFIVSACVFIIVKIYEMGRGAKTKVTEKDCDYCMVKIPFNAVRCPRCTTWLDWDVCTRVANRKRIAANAAAIGAGAPPGLHVDFADGELQHA